LLSRGASNEIILNLVEGLGRFRVKGLWNQSQSLFIELGIASSFYEERAEKVRLVAVGSEKPWQFAPNAFTREQ
jgi:hypothetical protein